MSSTDSILTRAQTARIRDLLRDKRARQAEAAFIVEGVKPVRDLLLSRPSQVQMLVTTDGYRRRESERDRLLRKSVSVPSYDCLDHTFALFSELQTPPGILAVVRQPQWSEPEVFGKPEVFGIYGEELQDPANVGAIIRTAAALNLDAVWLTPESADVYNPKVVRAASGAVLSLPVFVARDVTTFSKGKCAVYTAEAGGRGTAPMDAIRTVSRRMILAVGNESRGLSPRTIKAASRRFTIPLSRGVESLNVAATAAIALYYFGRLPKEP